MADIIYTSAPGGNMFFCDNCGRRVDDTDSVRGKCVVCGRKLCGNCVKNKNGKFYCPEHCPSECFIATAAYGSSMINEINVLRRWRDESLMNSKSGKIFVDAYYKISPPIANYISKSENRRAITRKLLTPIVNYFNKKYNN